MSFLDHFTTDETHTPLPTVRIIKKSKTPSGDSITAFGLDFCTTNDEVLPAQGIHTLGYLLVEFIRKHLTSKKVALIELSVQEDGSGFGLSVLGAPREKTVAKAWKASMVDVLNVEHLDAMPEHHLHSCNIHTAHSLNEAKNIAKVLLERGIGVLGKQQSVAQEN